MKAKDARGNVYPQECYTESGKFRMEHLRKENVPWIMAFTSIEGLVENNPDVFGDPNAFNFDLSPRDGKPVVARNATTQPQRTRAVDRLKGRRK